MRVADYEQIAYEVVLEMLQQERAVVWPEVEAKAADVMWPGRTIGINPHHLTAARRRLTGTGQLVPETFQTRGGRAIETFSLAGTPARHRLPASARKRLLHARYLGWASGTVRHPRGVVGAGAENVVHASLLAAAPAGYRLERPDGGDVRTFLGSQVQGGPLDSAAHLIVTQDGIPTGTVAVPIEVKNLRDWIYPHKPELFQLLSKAAHLQLAHQDHRIVPVLVCRRVHYTTAKMAKALGFYVIDLRRQYLVPTPDVDDDALHEVRTELGFADLIKSAGPDRVLVKHFRQSLPAIAERSAERWAQSAELLWQYFDMLRNAALTGPARAAIMNGLRQVAAEIEGDAPGGW